MKLIDISKQLEEIIVKNGLNTYLEHRKNSSVDTRVYKAVTTVLGITTSVINPLLEIVIIFLPDIINFLTAKSKEKNKKMKY